MRTFTGIIESNIEPVDTNSIWLKDDKFYAYLDSGWESIGDRLKDGTSLDDIDKTLDNLAKKVELKVDKVEGKNLSTNDLTDELKKKIEDALVEKDLSKIPVSKNYREVTVDNIQQIKAGDTIGGVYTSDSTDQEVAPWMVFEAGSTPNDDYPYIVYAMAVDTGDNALRIYEWRLTADGTVVQVPNSEKYEIPSSARVKTLLSSKQDKLTTTDDLAISSTNELSLSEVAKRQVFIDLWTRCYDCQYDETKDKPFTCNGVELTYFEAIDVYNAPRITYNDFPGCSMLIGSVKTLILKSSGTNGQHCSFANRFRTSQLVALRVSASYSAHVNNMNYAFYGDANLKSIFGIITLNASVIVTNAFGGCTALSDVSIQNLQVSISFQDSPNLSYESLRYLVDNAANINPITVTVHPDVYDKLTGTIIEVGKDPGEESGDDWDRSAVATTTDWQQLLPDAAAKNITFATV